MRFFSFSRKKKTGETPPRGNTPRGNESLSSGWTLPQRFSPRKPSQTPRGSFTSSSTSVKGRIAPHPPSPLDSQGPALRQPDVAKQQDSPSQSPSAENESTPSSSSPTNTRGSRYQPPRVEDEDEDQGRGRSQDKDQDGCFQHQEEGEAPQHQSLTPELQDSSAQPPPAKKPTKFCATCDAPTGLGCSRCQNISYCSVSCQTADWPVHKLLCWQFDLFQEPERPTPRHIRAVTFPTTSERPRFIWLRMLDRYARDMTMYLGDDNYVEKQGCENYACRLRPCNSQPLYVYSIHKQTPEYRARKPNICVPILSHPPGLAPHWRGPIIVAGEYGDLNMRDFRAAVDFLQACPDNMALMNHERYQGRVIEAVKINCDPDMAEHGVERLQRVQLSEFMLVSCRPTRIRMLFPYLDLVVRIAPILGSRRGSNPHCTLMFVFDRLFGGRHNEIFKLDELTEWRTGKYGVGTITVHRDDKKPLLPIHVIAFEDFVYEKAKLVADGQGLVWRGSIMLHLRRENLEAFWPEFLERQGLKGGRDEPPSPLDL